MSLEVEDEPFAAVLPCLAKPSPRGDAVTLASVIDGKGFASVLSAGIKTEVSRLVARNIVPGLAVVLVGDDPASQIYVRSKRRQAIEAGINSFEHRLPACATQDELLALVAQLNSDPAVHGILVQLPLPGHLSADLVIDAIDPAKDVDGFHVVNAGLLATGRRAMVPCTPFGCLLLLRDHLGSLSGRRAVVVGRSNIVGKPMAQLLLAENCTVTMAHSRTEDLERVCRDADILVAAVGRPRMIGAGHVRPGAVVIDVGINRVEEQGRPRLVGDVDFEAARAVAGAITPVPGGVGPMTIACLLSNTLAACCRIHGLDVPSGLHVG